MRMTMLKHQATLPSTSQLLTMGGDARIVCDPVTGTNKYYCAPLPNPSVLAYGSATASSISAHAFAAVDHLQQRLEAAAASEPAAVTYEREMHRVRGELRQLLGLANTDIVFASSGTDLHLFAAQLAADTPASPPVVIMMEATETGSGVPKALEGKHFSTTTVSGEDVVSGSHVAGAIAPDVIAVTCRKPDGCLRPTDEIDSEFASVAANAAASKRKLLLVLTDVSKTGLMMPSPGCVASIHQRFPGQVDILVDACQFRLCPATLRNYLEQGFLVAVTGSKFLSGPAFSGALFVPESATRRMRGRTLPHSFGQYSAAADWPRGWSMRSELPDVPNYGLLLRWQAALTELHRFQAIPETAISPFLERFAQIIQDYIAKEPAFEALPVPAPDRSAIMAGRSWDSIPTIFPFLLRHAGGNYLNREETDAVYQRMRTECNIEVGQPVLCGSRNGIPVSALRLCLSARLIVEALTPGGKGVEAIITDALFSLDKAAQFTTVR